MFREKAIIMPQATTTPRNGWLDFSRGKPWEKKGRRDYNRCGCNRMQSIRFAPTKRWATYLTGKHAPKLVGAKR
jgi:hypothetical protein